MTYGRGPDFLSSQSIIGVYKNYALSVESSCGIWSENWVDSFSPHSSAPLIKPSLSFLSRYPLSSFACPYYHLFLITSFSFLPLPLRLPSCILPPYPHIFRFLPFPPLTFYGVLRYNPRKFFLITDARRVPAQFEHNNITALTMRP